jgi:hypothetical protein
MTEQLNSLRCLVICHFKLLNFGFPANPRLDAVMMIDEGCLDAVSVNRIEKV